MENKEKTGIDKLEELLDRDDVSVTINPDGSIETQKQKLEPSGELEKILPLDTSNPYHY